MARMDHYELYYYTSSNNPLAYLRYLLLKIANPCRVILVKSNIILTKSGTVLANNISPPPIISNSQYKPN